MTEFHNFYILLPFAFIVGIALGSFVTMASYRLPLGSDIVFKPSYCPNCDTTLKILDLFPLFSWIFQRGKCRHCRSPISIRYPLTEFALGIVCVMLVFFYGLTISTLFFILLATELAILIVTDLEHFIIPDSLQIALFVTGIAYCIYRNTPAEGVFISVITGLSIGLLLHYGYFFLRHKDGLGWGDVKFLAVAGAWLPLSAFVPFLFGAGVIGTITGLLWRLKGEGAIFPFGPALACSLLLNVLIPDIIDKIFL